MGYTPEAVGKMTLDQVFFLLADRKNLRAGSRRTRKMSALEAGGVGLTKGRAADGTPITGKVAGKSLARQVMERKAAERAAKLAAEEAAKVPDQRARPGRRKRRGQ